MGWFFGGAEIFLVSPFFAMRWRLLVSMEPQSQGQITEQGMRKKFTNQNCCCPAPVTEVGALGRNNLLNVEMQMHEVLGMKLVWVAINKQRECTHSMPNDVPN